MSSLTVEYKCSKHENLESIIKKYDILSSFTEKTIKDYEKVHTSSKAAMRGVTTTVVAEIMEVGANGEKTMTTMEMTLGDVLLKMIQEGEDKFQTINSLLTQQAIEFELKMADLQHKARQGDLEAEAEYFDNLLSQSSQGMNTLHGITEAGQAKLDELGIDFETRSRTRLGRRLQFIQDMAFKEIALIDDREQEKKDAIDTRAGDDIAVLEKQRQDGLITNDEYDRKERVILENAEQAKTRIVINAENKRNEVRKKSNEDQIAAISQLVDQFEQYYNQIFSMFEMAFTNSIEHRLMIERNYHNDRMDILNDEMERELELHEGNSEAQENIRETYDSRREVAEAQMAEKEAIAAKKKFKIEKANSIVQAIIAGARAQLKILSDWGLPWGTPFMIAAGALTAAEIGIIASQKFIGKKGGLIPQFADGGMVHGPSHAQGGVKFNAGGRVVELEGGEAVINKRSTAMFHSQLSSMNQAGGGKRFADGGIMPGTSNMLSSVGGGINMAGFTEEIINGINNKKVIVTESDISTSQNNVSVTEATSSLF